MKLLRFAATNWKTTVAGILAAVVAIADGAAQLLDGNPLTNPDYTLIIAAVIAAIGLIFARDATVTSKQLGLDK